MEALEFLKSKSASKRPKSILELGTHRSNPNASTLHKSWFVHYETYIGTDLQPGVDVDVVADVHELSKVFGCNSVDCIVADAILEHVERPWIAAEEIMKVLKPGGLLFVAVPFAFPEHAHPCDYYRFTIHGLKYLFKDLTEVVANYHLPTTIDGSLGKHDAHYMVRLAGIK